MLVKKRSAPMEKMKPKPWRRKNTAGNFGLKVTVKQVTLNNTARRFHLGGFGYDVKYIPRRFWVALASSLVFLAVAWMCSSSIANKPLSPAMVQLCSVHRKLAARYPSSKPATIYDTLGLDPSKAPFHPTDLSTLDGNANAITSLIMAAYAERATDALRRHNSGRRDAKLQRRNDYWELRERGIALSPVEADEEWNDILVQAASILSSHELRELYDRVFLPVLSQYSVIKSEGAVSKKKRVKLAGLCCWEETTTMKP
ncbi:hypothetical protein EDB80DRAFT_818953 [Ilyonectria destructans]|nr:hypothetical protein EDB80DRAFT_818953 [Ilyonectria destructans]